MQIHDSLLTQIRDNGDNVRDVLLWMREIMTHSVALRVPLGVDFKVGKNWADIEKYKL